MIYDASDRNWVKTFYDSAAEWWGESWYDGENLPYRPAQVSTCSPMHNFEKDYAYTVVLTADDE